MIQLVTAENEAQFLALANQPSVTACKIHTLYQCYRDDPTMAQFWIFSRGERPMGILSLCSKVLTIWAPYLLAPEFAEFLNFIGWELVECDSTGIFSVANLLGAPVELLRIGIPCRYSASPAALADLRDMDAAKALALELLRGHRDRKESIH